MTNPQVRAVAGKLTRAQREALVHPSLGPFCTSIYSLTGASCRCALQRKGIVVDRMYATALTPLGLAVREYLLNPTQEPDDG